MRVLFEKYTSHSFVRFGIVGVYNTLIDLGMFLILYELFGWHPGVANVGAFMIANLQSYAINKYWAFRHPRAHKMSIREYSRFLTASLFTVVVSTTIITFGQKYAEPLILKLITILILPLLSYMLYRLIFKYHR